MSDTECRPFDAQREIADLTARLEVAEAWISALKSTLESRYFKALSLVSEGITPDGGYVSQDQAMAARDELERRVKAFMGDESTITREGKG